MLPTHTLLVVLLYLFSLYFSSLLLKLSVTQVIKVRESNKANLEDTAFWILDTALGAYIGSVCGFFASEISCKKRISKKR